MRAAKRTRKLFLAVLGGYFLLCAGLTLQQRAVIYMPFDGPTTPEAAGLAEFHQKHFKKPDGTSVIYWESEAATPTPTLLYFHGNGGGLHMFLPTLRYLHSHGFHVVAMEYRGYPGAPDGPSEPAIVSDGVALFDHIAAQNSPSPPAMWGYSLGSGIAIQVAAKRAPNALVLEAPFTAVVDRASEIFPIFPAPYLVRDTYLSRVAISHIHAPLLILHGEADRIIPLHHGQRLHTFANAPKQLKTYPGFGHLDLIESPAYDEALAFLKAQ